MRRLLRIYVDTSVIGGCFDAEFAPWSRGLIEVFRARRFSLLVFDVTAAEIEQAPLAVQRLFEEILDLGATVLPIDRQALGVSAPPTHPFPSVPERHAPHRSGHGRWGGPRSSAVIGRQRPGTAKGFVFLNLEDESGLVNVVVRPALFGRHRLLLVNEPFLLVEGTLQHREGVLSVRTARLRPLRLRLARLPSHDFR